MNISKFNEEIESYLNSAYLGMVGNPDFNRDRRLIFKALINNQQKRTLRMFKYTNLPETLSARSIEKYLQGSGTCLICYVSEDMITNPDAKGQAGLYALPCKPGGLLDANYLPTKAVVVSSWLGFSKEFDLTKNEAVLIWNDSLLEGLAPLFSLYASELTDNITTLHFQEVHNRILSIIKAASEDEKTDAKEFFTDYENGKFAALMNEDLIESLKNNRVDPFKGSANSSIKETLEARQWLLAHWNIELALNDNYNMKRESLNENEIEANSDTLTPLLDDMDECRKAGFNKVNDLWLNKIPGFSEAIGVELSSSWKRVKKREENAQKVEDAQTQIIEDQAKAGPSEDGAETPKTQETEKTAEVEQ